ncbi:MAG: DUF4080 domain-containing protein [Bacilli bacterium]
MKILLIGINAKYIHPAYGIYQIVANSNYSCDFIEYSIKDDNKKIIDYINKYNPDLLGFSVYIWNVEKVKELLPNLKNYSILLGGPEVTYSSEYFLLDYGVSYIIKGEGEESFNFLVDAIINKKPLNEVPNLYYKILNKAFFSFDKKPDISKIKHSHNLNKDFKNRIAYIESSRGCYFNCSYCMASTDKPVRFFSLEKLKEEISFLLKEKVKIIKFLDRSFNVNAEYTLAILNYIKANDNNHTTFQFEVIGDYINQDMIKLLKTFRSDMLRFEIGIQSLNKKTLKEIDRIQNNKLLLRTLKELNSFMITHLDLIAGLPYENLKSFKKTFNKTFLTFPKELQLGFLKELKGTKISLTKEKHKYIFEEESPYEVIQNKYLSKKDIEELKIVCKGLDTYYNKDNFPRTMEYLFKTLKLNPYKTFLALAKNLDNIKSFEEVTQNIYKTVKTKKKETLLYIIKQDYLTKFKIKPKIWWEHNITRKRRKELYEYLVKMNGLLSLELLYRYAHIEEVKDEIFTIIYKNQNNITIYTKKDRSI